ncbi:MAG: PorV/PorQ family protein [Bacteroidota bacterium]
MKKYFLQIISGLIVFSSANAGNPDRAGGAGATQLLVNPYSRSAGFGGVNTASVRGVEAFQFNIAGLAYTESTELVFARVNYLQGTGVNINTLSFAQSIGTGGNVIGLTISKWDFGNLPITSESQPDGTLGTFQPQVMNIGLAYAKKFSNSITGGMVLRYMSEGLTNLTSQGVGIDAGVQYQTALNQKNKIKKEDFRFGIGVRNIGPDMSYTGSGLSFKTIVNQSSGAQRTTYMGSQAFNLPALVNIGAAYDIRLDAKGSETYNHRLSPTGNFMYMAFSSNIVGLGVEYAYKESFMFRTAYSWQQNITTPNAFESQYYGVSGGFTIQVPVSKSGTLIGIDAGYTPTRVFNGIYNLGMRLVLGNKKS